MAFELTEQELKLAVAYMESAAQDALETPDHRHRQFIDELGEETLLSLCLTQDVFLRYCNQGEKLEIGQHNLIIDAYHNVIEDHYGLHNYVD